MRAYLASIITVVAACGPAASHHAREPAQVSHLHGQIQNDSGWQLPGISLLAISNEHRGTRSGLSDSHGNFVIRDLHPGEYRVLMLRGANVLSEQPLKVSDVAVQNIHFIVPASFGDRPSDRDRPIVDRALVRTTGP